MTFFLQCLEQVVLNLMGHSMRVRLKRPYMMLREQVILEELIDSLKPKRILEWGAGYSTRAFSSRLKNDFFWLSIESNPTWLETLSQQISNPNVHLKFAEEKEYDKVSINDGPFDLIIIDGIKRLECMKMAVDLLSESGIVFLHDANRVDYHSSFSLFQEKWLLLDYRRTAGGVAIFSRKTPVSTVVNCEKHQRRWGLIRNPLAKVLAI